MEYNNLNNQYNWKFVKMDGLNIVKLNIKRWISSRDMVMKLIDKYTCIINKWSVLDMGCGDWELCKLLEKKFEKIYWVDLLQDRIDRFYTKNNDSKIKLSVWDLNKRIDYWDKSFDCITSLITLDWVYNLDNALSEIHRILKQDWIFILQVNNLWFLPRRLKLLFWNHPKISAFSKSEWKNIGWDANICHTFTEKELTRLLKKYWFKVIEKTGTGLFYKLRNWRPGLLCWDLFYVLKKIS